MTKQYIHLHIAFLPQNYIDFELLISVKRKEEAAICRRATFLHNWYDFNERLAWQYFFIKLANNVLLIAIIKTWFSNPTLLKIYVHCGTFLFPSRNFNPSSHDQKEKSCTLLSSFKLNKNMDWFFIGPIYTLLKKFCVSSMQFTKFDYESKVGHKYLSACSYGVAHKKVSERDKSKS